MKRQIVFSLIILVILIFFKLISAEGGGGGINYDTNPTTARTDAIRDALTDGINGNPRIEEETTPASLGLNYMIKY